MDSFHTYLKKQLLEYVESERKKGIPLEEIEKVLMDAGHKKNIIDEVFLELEREEAGGEKAIHKDPVENDLISQLKNAFSQFMAQASGKEVEEAKKDFKKTDTEELVKEVIEEAEIIEEKTMFESVLFFVYLFTLALIILFTAGSTDSDIVKVIIGFSPTFINAFISFASLKLADNVPIYVFIPLLIASAFYGLGKFSGIGLFDGMDVESLSIVNFIFGFVFNISVIYIRFLKPESMKKIVMKTATEEKSEAFKKTAPKQEILELKHEFNIK